MIESPKRGRPPFWVPCQFAGKQPAVSFGRNQAPLFFQTPSGCHAGFNFIWEGCPFKSTQPITKHRVPFFRVAAAWMFNQLQWASWLVTGVSPLPDLPPTRCGLAEFLNQKLAPDPKMGCLLFQPVSGRGGNLKKNYTERVLSSSFLPWHLTLLRLLEVEEDPGCWSSPKVREIE